MSPIKTFLLVTVASGICLSVAQAEDWKTTDGMVYKDVKVIRVEDDAITIMYRDGGALVPLQKLPAPIQKQFSYDPVKAKIAAEARQKEDAENNAALQREIDEAATMKKKQQIEDAKHLNHLTNAPGTAGP
jgi:hypothetical protein